MNSTTRRLLAFGAALAFVVAIPAAAQAATLINSGGTLTYAVGPGTSSDVSFFRTSPTTITLFRNGDDEPISATNCTMIDEDEYDCEDVTNIVADGGDGTDWLWASSLDIPVSFTGGDGDDSLYGGNASDSLSGGAGDDYTYTGAGADSVSGGTGIDGASVFYSGFETQGASSALPVSVTLDGVANDGTPGQGANIYPDVENTYARSSFSPIVGPTQYGTASVIGSADANDISGGNGPDTIDGSAGNDRINGFEGDDLLNARDGYADVVYCDAGADTAIVDTLDQVSASCENVSTADVGNANEDKPPAIAWAAPAAGAKVAGSKVTPLTVTATDDKAVANVQFLDDGVVVCTITVAPYTCNYQAKGTDLGDNTLIAIASDAAGQTASSVRSVSVTRFVATSLSLKATPGRDRAAPYSFTAKGALARNTSVAKSANCAGSVKVALKAGSKTLKTKTVKLSKNCTYTARLSMPTRSGIPGNGRLRLQATFAGNDTIASKKSPTRTVRTK